MRICVGTVAIVVMLLVAPAARAGVTGTLSISDEGQVGADGTRPPVVVTWSLSCPGATDPVYTVDGPLLLRVGDGTDLASSVLNLVNDPMPTSGMLTEGENPGTTLQAMWRANTIGCMSGPGAGNMGGGPNDVDIVSNQIVVPPAIYTKYLLSNAPDAKVTVGDPLYLSLAGSEAAFAANPARASSEIVSVHVSGAGILFDGTYSADDWNAGKFLTDWRTLIPTSPGVIQIYMAYQQLQSNAVAVTAVSADMTGGGGSAGSGGGGGNSGTGAKGSGCAMGGSGSADGGGVLALALALAACALARRRRRV